MYNIYLVGFMGAGKSAVGRAVARRLARDFVDLDAAVEGRLGMAIPEIFSTRGEAGFRAAETEELERTTGRDRLVVATGGGAFSNAANRRLIERSGGTSVFLDVPWRAIRRRLDDGTDGRPKWVDDDHARCLLEQRRPDYDSASVRLELAGDESPDEVASRIEAALAEHPCAS